MKPLRVVCCLLSFAAFGLAKAQTVEPGNVPGAQAPQNETPRAPTPPPERVRVSSGVMMGQRIYVPKLDIPTGVSTSGGVILHVVIGKDGAVQSMQLLRGSPELAEAVMAAVRQWKYKPYLRNGHPVEVETTITLVW